MSDWLRYYNLHGLLSLKASGKGRRLLNILDDHLSLFAASPTENTDLEVFVHDFQPSQRDWVVVDDKYYVSGDSLYCRDSHKVSNWKLWIEKLTGKTTRIHFTGDPLFSHAFLFKYLVEPVMFFKLTLAGYSFAHSSCVADSERAYLFAASKGVGKTSTALALVEAGTKLFSDEYTIISPSGQALSYPGAIHLHQYNLAALPFLGERLPLKDRMWISFKGWIYNASFKYANLAHNVVPSQILPNLGIGDSSPLGAVILLSKVTTGEYETKEIEASEMAKRIVAVNRLEVRQFADYLTAFTLSDGFSDIALHWERVETNLKRALDNVPLFELKVPVKYDTKTSLVIRDIVKSLIKTGEKAR